MIRIPTAYLENIKIQRIIFSINKKLLSDEKASLHLMKNIYERGALCFYLPTTRHLHIFRKLKEITEDEYLTGIGHLNIEEGACLLGRPLHYFESKIISTIIMILPSELVKNTISTQSFSEVLTQKEIDRIAFDSERLESELSNFNITETKIIILNGRYGEWLLTLGRIDLIIKTVERVKKKGFISIFSGQWTPYFLPKARSIEVAAYAVPINKKRGAFNFEKESELIKKFEKPVIALNPFANGRLLKKSREIFSFIFDELKILATIIEISSTEELKKVLDNISGIHSIIPPRKT